MTITKVNAPGRTQLAVAALVLLIGSGFARAEDKKPDASNTANAGNTGDRKPRPVPLTPQQQSQMASSIVSRGQELAQRLMHMVDEARREGDMIKLACLNDKLQQANANVGTAQARLDALAKATDGDSRAHEFTVLSVIGQKFQTLDQEANQCVGQDLYETGATKVQTEINNSMLPFDNSSSTLPSLIPPGVPSFPHPASGTK